MHLSGYSKKVHEEVLSVSVVQYSLLNVIKLKLGTAVFVIDNEDIFFIIASRRKNYYQYAEILY